MYICCKIHSINAFNITNDMWRPTHHIPILFRTALFNNFVDKIEPLVKVIGVKVALRR